MMRRRLMSGATLSAVLMCAWGMRAFAGTDPKDVKYVDDMIQSTSKSDPDMAKALMSHMKETNLSTEDIVNKRVSAPTPGNVQQYGGQQQEASTTRSLSASASQARAVLERAGGIVEQARGTAKDTPRKYVAETGGKVVNLLDKTYNDVSEQVQEQVNTMRAELEEMVAIALVINSAGGGNGAQKKKKSKAGENGAASITQPARGYFNEADAEVGQRMVALVTPELPISRRGQMLFEDANKRVKDIPQMLAAKAENLDKAKKWTQDLAQKESGYHKGMKGMGGAEGTSQVLMASIESLGGYLVMLNDISKRMEAFMEGPGRAIYDVVHCSQAVYDAGVAMQQDLPYERQLALSQEALDSNLKAARGVGPMAREFRTLLNWMGGKVSADKINPPSFAQMGAPKGGMSPSVPETGINAAKREATKL